MNRREILLSGLGAASVFSASRAFAGQMGRATDLAAARRLQDSTLLVDGLDPSALTERYLGMVKAAGVDVWHHSMGGFASFAHMLKFCDKHSDSIVPVGSVKEIKQAQKDGKVGHLSGWQSADPLLADEYSQLPPIGNLRAYRELGLRICGIVYNLNNSFGGGAFEDTNGLSHAGHRLVDEIHSERIVLDVGGHTGERTSFDALEVSKGVPIICSHTNLRSIMDNPRNITDKLVEKIAATGGVIGLTSVNDFHARNRRDVAIPITPQVGLDKHLDQYDYLKKLVGVDHISLGPDFMFDRTDLNHMIPELWMPEAHSNNPPWFMIKGYETISELPNVTQGLMQRGWTDAEIRKVLGENLMRVYQQVWGE